MRSGSVTEQPMVELLCSLAAQKASGMLQVRQGKKLRTFYFEGGTVSLTKSNLKSESLARLEEKHPGVARAQLLELQGALRVRNTVAQQDGDWTFKGNEAPPARRPLELTAACWGALLEVVPDSAIKGRLAGLMQRFPVLDPAGVSLEQLPFPDALKELLSQLDGERPLRDVADFAPVPPEQALQALYFAMICGVIRLEEQGVGAKITVQDEDDESEEQDTGDAMDAVLADLFGGELEDTPPSRSEELPAPPPAPAADEDLSKLRRQLDRVKSAENHFEVLSIAWDATDAGYRKAYFGLAQELHPDRWVTHSNEHGQLAGDIFARVSEAWEVLGDKDKRQVYVDSVIHGIKSEDELAMEKVQDILAAENDFKAGTAEFRAGRFVQAHEHFKDAWEKVPEEHEFAAYYGYTLFKVNQGRDAAAAEKGEEMVRSAVDKGTKLHNGWMLAGMIYRDKGQLDTAQKALLMCLKMNPSNLDAQNELKRVRRGLERQKKEEAAAKGLGGFVRGLFGKKK